MPAWVVIYRRHHRKAAPYRHVTKNTSPQLLLFLTLTNCDACNPFRIRSYENCRVTSFKPNIFLFPSISVPTLALLFLTPIFRIFFQVPYPAPPLLASLMRLLHPERFYGTKTAGVCTNNSHSGSPRSRPWGTRHSHQSLAPVFKFFLFTLLRTLLRFFAHTQNSTLFFSRDSALFARNHRGGGRVIC